MFKTIGSVIEEYKRPGKTAFLSPSAAVQALGFPNVVATNSVAATARDEWLIDAFCYVHSLISEVLTNGYNISAVSIMRDAVRHTDDSWLSAGRRIDHTLRDVEFPSELVLYMYHDLVIIGRNRDTVRVVNEYNRDKAFTFLCNNIDFLLHVPTHEQLMESLTRRPCNKCAYDTMSYVESDDNGLLVNVAGRVAADIVAVDELPDEWVVSKSYTGKFAHIRHIHPFYELLGCDSGVLTRLQELCDSTLAYKQHWGSSTPAQVVAINKYTGEQYVLLEE